MKLININQAVTDRTLIATTEYEYDLDNNGEICGGLITTVFRQNTPKFPWKGDMEVYNYKFGRKPVVRDLGVTS